jgi:hypothetical protein
VRRFIISLQFGARDVNGFDFAFKLTPPIEINIAIAGRR